MRCPLGKGSRLKAQGLLQVVRSQNSVDETQIQILLAPEFWLLTSFLMPCALRLKPPLLVNPLDYDPALRTGLLDLNKFQARPQLY